MASNNYKIASDDQWQDVARRIRAKQNTLTTGDITTNLIADKAITVDKIADGAVTIDKITGLADVATSGSYTDLSDTPTIPVVNDATLTMQKNGVDVGTFTANQADNTIVDFTVPTSVSELTNDSNYVVSTDLYNSFYTKNQADTLLSEKANTSDLPVVNDATLTVRRNGNDIGTFTANQASDGYVDITVPTATSDITNDSGYITDSTHTLENYYPKWQTYTQTEIDALIDILPKFGIAVVTELPTEDIATDKIYLVTSDDSSTLYTEYIYVDDQWYTLGTANVTFDGYYTQEQVDAMLALKANLTDIDEFATITMTTTDPGEGATLAENHFIAVYNA